MKWQQSYVLWVAVSCTAMIATLASTLVYDVRLAELNSPASSVDSAPDQMVRVSSARAALKDLTSINVEYDRTVQLPLAPVIKPGVAALPSGFDADAAFQLTTIALGGGQRSAVVSGRLVHVGDRLDGSTVVLAITANTVRIKRAGQTSSLTMHAGTDDSAKQ